MDTRTRGQTRAGTAQRAQRHSRSHIHALCQQLCFPSNPFSTILYSALALRGWPFRMVATIPLCPVIPREVWPLRGDIITDPYDHFNRFRTCNIMGDKNTNEIQLYFYILGKYNHKLKIFKGYFLRASKNDEILREWFYKGWQVVYTKNLKGSLRGSKKKKKTKERLAILMYQKIVFLRCKSGESLQSSLQSKSKSQQASVQNRQTDSKSV